MADLIDREELKLQIAKQSRYFGFGFINKIIAIINEQPSADTERHAHWIRINDVLSQCSNCKTTILRCDTDNYCSHCGCKMDEVEDETHSICAYRLKNDGSDISEKVFLTKEEAEAKLKELNGNE